MTERRSFFVILANGRIAEVITPLRFDDWEIKTITGGREFLTVKTMDGLMQYFAIDQVAAVMEKGVVGLLASGEMPPGMVGQA